jgi:hypothetical protein
MDELAAAAPFPLPPPETIRQTAAEIVSRPEYELDRVGPDFGPLLERIGELLRRILRPAGRALGALFDISPVLGWTVSIALALLAVALIAHIVYTFVRAMRSRRLGAPTFTAVDELETQPQGWERRAREALERSDYIGAVRCLFRACLLRLELAHQRTLRRGATNREYLHRFRDTAAHDPMALFVETIDMKWYGGGACTEGDYRACSEAHAQIRRFAEEIARAHGS